MLFMTYPPDHAFLLKLDIFRTRVVCNQEWPKGVGSI